jgi:ATP phosphoribosyltransferase
MNKNETYTQILLPGGEWFSSILDAFSAIGLALNTSSDRCYRYSFVTQALPIVFDVIRSWDVPDVANDLDTSTWTGLTGTDILKEKGLEPNFIFPILEFVPSAPQAILYLGITPNYPEDARNDLNLDGSTVYTTYPNIATAFLEQLGQKNVTVKYKAGKIEGLWRVDPNNLAVLEISASGKTAVENSVTFYKEVMKPDVAGYISPLAPTQDRERMNDLQEIFYQAMKGKA